MMNKMLRTRNLLITLSVIILLTSISFQTHAAGEHLSGWKKAYYDFMTDYTRLYPDMDSEAMKTGDFGKPDFVNGQRTDSQELHPLYHKTENIKLLNITGSEIPEMIVVTYGNFTGDWIGSSTCDTQIDIYKYINGQIKKIYQSKENLLELLYKTTGNTADIIVMPGYPQYSQNPQVFNLVWNENAQTLEERVNKEDTHTLYSTQQGRSSPDYMPNYFKDKGYSRLYYIDNDTDIIKVEDNSLSMYGRSIRSHYIEYTSEPAVRYMLSEFEDFSEEDSKEDLQEQTQLADKGEETLFSRLWNSLASFLRTIFKPLTSIFSSGKDQSVMDKTDPSKVEESPDKEEQAKRVKSLDIDQASSKDGYRTYINNKYGFMLDYPSDFEKSSDSNENFVKFYSQDRKAILTGRGEENTLGKSLNELYHEDIEYVKSITTIDYKANGENWYVISWISDNKTYYKRVYVGSRVINTMLMESPNSEGYIYDTYVSHISLAFKPGNLSSLTNKDDRDSIQSKKTNTKNPSEVQANKAKSNISKEELLHIVRKGESRLIDVTCAYERENPKIIEKGSYSTIESKFNTKEKIENYLRPYFSRAFIESFKDFHIKEVDGVIYLAIGEELPPDFYDIKKMEVVDNGGFKKFRIEAGSNHAQGDYMTIDYNFVYENDSWLIDEVKYVN